MTNFNRTFKRLLCTTAAAAALLTVAPPEAHADHVGVPFAQLAPVLEGKLNVNTATQKQWELLPGIGPAIAKRIVSYRSKSPFREVTHVMRVKGVGRKTYAAIKPYLSLKGETTLRAVGKAKGRSSAGK